MEGGEVAEVKQAGLEECVHLNSEHMLASAKGQ